MAPDSLCTRRPYRSTVLEEIQTTALGAHPQVTAAFSPLCGKLDFLKGILVSG